MIPSTKYFPRTRIRFKKRTGSEALFPATNSGSKARSKAERSITLTFGALRDTISRILLAVQNTPIDSAPERIASSTSNMSGSAFRIKRNLFSPIFIPKSSSLSNRIRASMFFSFSADSSLCAFTLCAIYMIADTTNKINKKAIGTVSDLFLFCSSGTTDAVAIAVRAIASIVFRAYLMTLLIEIVVFIK